MAATKELDMNTMLEYATWIVRARRAGATRFAFLPECAQVLALADDGALVGEWCELDNRGTLIA